MSFHPESFEMEDCDGLGRRLDFAGISSDEEEVFKMDIERDKYLSPGHTRSGEYLARQAADLRLC